MAWSTWQKPLDDKGIQVSLGVIHAKVGHFWNRIHDESKHDEEERNVPSEAVECNDTERFERFDLDWPAQCFQHVIVESHRRLEWFGVFPEDEAVVDVEKSAFLRQHHVLRVAISNAQQERNDRVGRQGLSEGR